MAIVRRPIQVGDDLTGKTIYCNWIKISNATKTNIQVIRATSGIKYDGGDLVCGFVRLPSVYDSDGNPAPGIEEDLPTLPPNFVYGVVTSVDYTSIPEFANTFMIDGEAPEPPTPSDTVITIYKGTQKGHFRNNSHYITIKKAS